MFKVMVLMGWEVALAPADVTPQATAVTEVQAKTRLAARRAGRGIRIEPGYPVKVGGAGSAPGTVPSDVNRT
jgi:hypothetical protein